MDKYSAITILNVATYMFLLGIIYLASQYSWYLILIVICWSTNSLEDKILGSKKK